VSFDSEPEEPKNTWLIFFGAISASFFASKAGDGVVQRKNEL
jgi:hypothetical protein